MPLQSCKALQRQATHQHGEICLGHWTACRRQYLLQAQASSTESPEHAAACMQGPENVSHQQLWDRGAEGLGVLLCDKDRNVEGLCSFY